jgi:hypothetical protein
MYKKKHKKKIKKRKSVDEQTFWLLIVFDYYLAIILQQPAI